MTILAIAKLKENLINKKTKAFNFEGKMKVKRNIIEIDENSCDGCGLCVLTCAKDAIKIVDGKAKLVFDTYCDGLGLCIKECPRDALKIVERDADEFDHIVAESHMKVKVGNHESSMVCGCPSRMIRTFSPRPASQTEDKPSNCAFSTSALSHWPVQISLIPPTAPFLKGAHILVAADCTPIAYPRFHEDFLKGRKVLVGCPKLDDAAAYIHKLTQIFSIADIRSITFLVMEVPCCQGLADILKKAMHLAGKKIPMGKIIISSLGEIIMRESI